mgnify:CR=1 FL=1
MTGPELTEAPIAAIPQSPAEISLNQAAIIGNNYIWNGEDKTRVLLFFCGAVKRSQLHLAPVFHRWKWASMFRHPVIICSDPSVSLESGLTLGWYVGRQEGPTFDDQMAEVVDLAQQLAPGGRIGAFGSSGGGFAALMALVRGHAESALAINPQTNILNYQRVFVKRLLSYYGKGEEELDSSDMTRFSIAAAIPKFSETSFFRGRILVNSFDTPHWEDHVDPLQRFCDQRNIRGLEFLSYDSASAVHTPPPISQSLWLINDFWPDSLQGHVMLKLKPIRSLRRRLLDPSSQPPLDS